MKISRIFRSIVAVVIAFGLFLAPAGDIPVLQDFEITANAKDVGSGLSWTFEGGTLTISGNGDMNDFGQSDQPWVSYRDYITEVVIENGITYIGDNSFYGYSVLKSVTIKCNSAWAGKRVFYGCTNLTEVTITNPNGLTAQAGMSVSSGSFYASGNPALTVYFGGTESDWSTLKSKTAADGNDRFKGANVKYVREITLNANNGSGATDTRYLEYNKEVTLPDCPFTAANKHFKCWAKDAAGTNQYGSTAKFTAATTLYAIWEDD